MKIAAVSDPSHRVDTHPGSVNHRRAFANVDELNRTSFNEGRDDVYSGIKFSDPYAFRKK